jgi:hypothetical protein
MVCGWLGIGGALGLVTTQKTLYDHSMARTSFTLVMLVIAISRVRCETA